MFNTHDYLFQNVVVIIFFFWKISLIFSISVSYKKDKFRIWGGHLSQIVYHRQTAAHHITIISVMLFQNRLSILLFFCTLAPELCTKAHVQELKGDKYSCSAKLFFHLYKAENNL